MEARGSASGGAAEDGGAGRRRAVGPLARMGVRRLGQARVDAGRRRLTEGLYFVQNMCHIVDKCQRVDSRST